MLDPAALEAPADHTGAVVGFRTRKGKQVNARVASSFVSPEQALRNLDEIGSSDFEAVKQQGRVEVEGGTADQRRTFYSCLYRALLFPRKLYELDASGKAVHYSPFNGKVLPGFRGGRCLPQRRARSGHQGAV